MKLDELKAKNEEAAEVETEETQETDEVTETEETEETDETKGDLEPWQETDDQTSDKVPVGTHIKVKQKLKGRISERDEEIERLKAEVEALRKGEPKKTDLPTPPKEEDFDTDEEFHKAQADYQAKLLDTKLASAEKKREQAAAMKAKAEATTQAVDAHYDRAAKLVEESGIDPEIYKGADAAVRAGIEAILPRQGDVITDHIISLMGEGSEKVLYYLGRNKTALAEVKGLLSEDPSGMKLAIYLGEQKKRLTEPQKRTSRAPKPPTNVDGDATGGNVGAAEFKKYQAAKKKGDMSTAYNIKSAARKAGVDVSGWLKES